MKNFEGDRKGQVEYKKSFMSICKVTLLCIYLYSISSCSAASASPRLVFCLLLRCFHSNCVISSRRLSFYNQQALTLFEFSPCIQSLKVAFKSKRIVLGYTVSIRTSKLGFVILRLYTKKVLNLSLDRF